MSIGKRLGEERDRLGFSQEDLGEIGGVKKNAQFQYEKDKRSPSADYLASVAIAGVDVAYVLTGIRSQLTENALSQRETAVLDHYRNTDEVGRRAIEQTASALAQSSQKVDSKKRA